MSIVTLNSSLLCTTSPTARALDLSAVAAMMNDDDDAHMQLKRVAELSVCAVDVSHHAQCQTPYHFSRLRIYSTYINTNTAIDING